jgi:phage terminase large subunit-like protein
MIADDATAARAINALWEYREGIRQHYDRPENVPQAQIKLNKLLSKVGAAPASAPVNEPSPPARGDMVRATLAQAAPPCAVRLVHASRGKRARAEPIAALYEQGRVTHCDAFAALEEELLALGASESEGLLDRADALVWALSALMEGSQREGPRVRVLGGDTRRFGLSRP